MPRIRFLTVVMLGLCLALAACQKIEEKVLEPIYVSDASFSVVPGEFSDAVPAEYGRLVSVNFYPNRPRVAVLWFESMDGDITMVRVDLQANRVVEGVLTIPRR